MIKIIVAKASNNVIGNKNELIWRLPNDLKHFKAATSHHPIVMGRKTYESLGRPLPNRTNIVISRDQNWTDEQITKASSLAQGLAEAQKIDETIFVIGGGQVYKQAMEFADELVVTEVHQEFEGDTYFPEIDEEIWEEVSREYHYKDELHLQAYSFVCYQRIKEEELEE